MSAKTSMAADRRAAGVMIDQHTSAGGGVRWIDQPSEYRKSPVTPALARRERIFR
jgi:hypothetical protein